MIGKRLHSVNFDMESKAGHFPKQSIPMEVLVTWIYFMIELICNNVYKYNYANEINNLEANAGSRFTTEDHLPDFVQKGSLSNQYLENVCSHFVCLYYSLPSSDFSDGPNSGA